MEEKKPSLLRRVLGIAAEVVVAIYVVLDAIVAPLFGPFMRFLSSLRLIRRLEALIAGLPPYVILVLLVVPFGFAELAKVYAVLLMAEEHFRSGMTIFIGAYVVSILVCERTFHAGQSQLMTIGWFKVAFDWVMAAKAHVLDWFRGTRVGRLAADWKAKASATIGRIRVRIQAFARTKPKPYADEYLERR